MSRKIKNGSNLTLIIFRGEAVDGKLRFGALFFYGQGSYTIFLRQWRENSISLAAKWPGNHTFVATVQKKIFLVSVQKVRDFWPLRYSKKRIFSTLSKARLRLGR